MAIINDDGSTTEVDKHPALQSKAPVSEPGFLEPGSSSEAALRGFSNAATLGLGKYIQAPIRAALGEGDPKKGFIDNTAALFNEQRDANDAAQAQHPWWYGGGSVAGAAPMALGAAALTVPRMAAAGAGAAGLTTLADTQDPIQAAKSAALGAVIPVGAAGVAKVAPAVVDVVKKVAGIPEATTKKVATMVADLSQNPAAKKAGVVNENGNVVQPITSGVKASEGVPKTLTTKQLAEDVSANGPSVLDQPQFMLLKKFLGDQASGSKFSSAGSAIAKLGDAASKGGGAGAVVGMPGTGAALNTMRSVPSVLKDIAVNREVKKALSPAAVQGAKEIEAALANSPSAGSQALGHGTRWAAVTNVMNQTNPKARAATNSENPQNDE
jgi:hypothetical protein